MTAQEPIRVLLVDDDETVHRTVLDLLDAVDDLQLMAYAVNGKDALDLCARFTPDVVLMDVMMPVMDGIEATHIIRRRHPQIKVLALSASYSIWSIRAMLKAGAVGYVLKSPLPDNLASALRAVHAGKVVFSREISQTLLSLPQ